MTDALLTMNDREEALSCAYVEAVAAAAGYVTSKMNFDRDGIDIQVRASGLMRPSLDIQLKATINFGESNGSAFRFPLKRRNYDLLRGITMIPRVLVVLELPKEEGNWLVVTSENLIMRRCAYWASLAGLPDSENAESVTVSVPSNNRLDVQNLKLLMEKARRGTIA